MTKVTKTTTCPLDCPDTCALEVVVDDGKVCRIRAGTGHPVTGGFICSKVSRFAKRLTHRQRLQHPMRRTGAKGSGRFEQITWETAIAEISERFRGVAARWGGEAILGYHYGGSNGVLTDGFIDDLFFARLGASRLARTICAAPTAAVAAGMYGRMPGVAFQDYVEAKCIIIWGANPKASNTHLVPYLKEAKKRGCFIATVDPVRNFSAREVDLHLPLRPGTDLPVALAMLRICLEQGRLDEDFIGKHTRRCETILAAARQWPVDRAADVAGVSAADIRALAAVYADANPALVRCGWGVERNNNGGQAVAAILALPALLGKFGVRGGGYTMSNSGAVAMDRARLFDLSGWNTRVINMTCLGEVLAKTSDPPIKGLFIYNCNPAVTVPDQAAVLRGLSRNDLFTVVFDQVMTDTAQYADIILPATTFLEHRDIRVSYGSYVVGGVMPVVDPVGDARSNQAVFAELGRTMSFDDDAFHWDERTAFECAADALSLEGAAADVEALSTGRTQNHSAPAFRPVQFRDAYPRTSDGAIDLCPDVLGPEPYAYRSSGNGPYPLSLISPATSMLVTSTLGEFNLPKLWVALNSLDAAERGISNGDSVKVFNQLGEVLCEARVTDAVRPGVASMPKGAWRHSSENGFTSTALCPATVNVVAGGACYNDARVEVERGSRE